MNNSLSNVMAQKEEYQLKWISENKNAHSADEVQAAIKELKRRQMPGIGLNDIFKRCWKSITSIFGYMFRFK